MSEEGEPKASQAEAVAQAPPPPDSWINSDTWSDDYLALHEEEKFPDERQLRAAYDRNKLRVIRHSGIIIVAIMWIVTGVFLAAFVLWIWHQLAPPGFCWMTPEQLAKVQTIIFSGAVGGLVTTAVQKYILNGK